MEDEDQFIATIGARIQQLRFIAGLTQQEMAERLGCCVRNYQRLETGLTNMSLRSLIRVALALNMTPAELLAVPRRTDSRHGSFPSAPSYRYRASVSKRRRRS